MAEQGDSFCGPVCTGGHQRDRGPFGRGRADQAVGAERFAEYIFNKVNDFIIAETEGRVKVAQVEFREHEKNTAFYKG
jgi:hypothetical protein